MGVGEEMTQEVLIEVNLRILSGALVLFSVEQSNLLVYYLHCAVLSVGSWIFYEVFAMAGLVCSGKYVD